jgi:hypothetical protein
MAPTGPSSEWLFSIKLEAQFQVPRVDSSLLKLAQTLILTLHPAEDHTQVRPMQGKGPPETLPTYHLPQTASGSLIVWEVDTEHERSGGPDLEPAPPCVMRAP